MAEISINTSCLHDAAESAKSWPRGTNTKIKDYYEQLHVEVIKRIDKYTGTHTGYINSARQSVNNYIGELKTLKSAFETFAQDAEKLRSKAIAVEEKIISSMNTNLSEFCKKHNLEYNPSDESPGFWAGLLGKVELWWRNARDKWDSFKEHFMEWFKYDGGKEILDAAFAIVGVIIAVVIAVVTFPVSGTLAIVLAAIALVITVLNAAVKIFYAIDAVNAAQKDHYFDAAWSAKKRDEGSFSEWMRDMGWYDAANAFDVVDTVVTVLQFIQSLPETFKNAKNFFHDFSFKGFFTDFGKNMKDFFSKDAIGHLLFGGKYDGNFFGGNFADVMKRIKTVFTLTEVAYKELTYHDATGNKSGLTIFQERLTIGKPVIDTVMSNMWKAGSTRRHDMVTDPKSARTTTVTNPDGSTTTTTTTNVKDASTGKVTGKQTTTTTTNKDGSSYSRTQSEYTYHNADGTGETKTIIKDERISANGGKDTYTQTTTQKTTDTGSLFNKKDYQTTTTEDSWSYKGSQGTEHTETQTSTHTENTDYNWKGQKTGTEVSNSHSNSSTDIRVDSNGSSVKTTTNSSHSSGTTTSYDSKGRTTGVETTHSSSSSNTQVQNGFDGKTSTTGSSSSRTSEVSTSYDSHGRKTGVETTNSYQTTQTQTNAKGRVETTTHSQTATGDLTAKTNRDASVKTTTTKADSAKPLDVKTPPTKPEAVKPGESPKAPEVKQETVSAKVSTQSDPNLRGTVKDWDKNAKKVNEAIQTVSPGSGIKVPTTSDVVEKIVPEGARKYVNDGIKIVTNSGSAVDTVNNLNQLGKDITGYSKPTTTSPDADIKAAGNAVKEANAIRNQISGNSGSGGGTSF